MPRYLPLPDLLRFCAASLAGLLVLGLASCDTQAVATGPTSDHPQAQHAWLIHGGTLLTMNPQQPEVEAMLVEDGRIQRLGSLAELQASALGRVAHDFDLQGGVLYPGFVDGHAHLVGIGLALTRVDLVGTQSFAAVVERVQSYVAKQPSAPGAWIQGRGWDQNDWAVKEFPQHERLSRAFPKVPVVLRRIDGHALLANQAAMDAAGINHQTPDPKGGRILRDADGRPSGVFVDGAMSLIGAAMPDPSAAEIEQAVRLAAAEMHRRGLTAIHDAGASDRDIEIYRRLASAGDLDLRVHVMLHGGAPDLIEKWFARGPLIDPDGQVNVRAVKMYMDGALGSRGAALLEDYADEAGNRGLLLSTREQLEKMALACLKNGFQLCTHAIGDRGNRLVLDAYEAAFAAVAREQISSVEARSVLTKAARFRVEHAQVLAPADIPRFAALGVIPAMQAQHQASDMPWAEDRLGPERVHGAYAWRSLLETGVVIPGGSDAPVERLDPIGAFLASVARTDRSGQPPNGWYPEQNMTREEGLKHLTTWPAYAAFEEGQSGQLKPGFRADFTVLDTDLRSVATDQIAQSQVLWTIFAGRVVYERGGE
jgi:predicted amidohydrolase YtcJ